MKPDCQDEVEFLFGENQHLQKQLEQMTREKTEAKRESTAGKKRIAELERQLAKCQKVLRAVADSRVLYQNAMDLDAMVCNAIALQPEPSPE